MDRDYNIFPLTFSERLIKNAEDFDKIISEVLQENSLLKQELMNSEYENKRLKDGLQSRDE